MRIGQYRHKHGQSGKDAREPVADSSKQGRVKVTTEQTEIPKVQEEQKCDCQSKTSSEADEASTPPLQLLQLSVLPRVTHRQPSSLWLDDSSPPRRQAETPSRTDMVSQLHPQGTL